MLLLLLKSMCRVLGLIPLPAALAIGRVLGWSFGHIIRHRRKESLETLRCCLPEKSEAERRRILNAMYLNLGMNVIEEFRLVSMSASYLNHYIIWEHEETARKALADGKGLLVLTGHMGSWDLLCSIAPRFNYPTTIITKEIKNKTLNTLWMEVRSRFGLKFVPAHNSYRQCLTALRKNEIVGFTIDQNMIDTEGLFVDFFGKPACTTPGLAFMSAQSGAPVVPVFIIRDNEGRHRVKVGTAIAPPPDRKPETILHYTQLYTKVMEDIIRAYPDQWIWIHRRWKTKPKGGESNVRTAKSK